MYQVKRAVIMAAGIGKRLRPVTLEIPKPLIRIGRERLIDTVIKGLHANGIYEIYVIVGYLKEQFYCLEREYPGVILIENPYYENCNNISSLYVAREFIKDVMILDGDQMIYNDEILNTSFERSGYNCVWTEDETDEWLLTVKNGIVTHCSRNGGKKGWQLFSVSRWTEKDGRRLRHHVEIEFEKKHNCQIYWDDIALFCYPDEYTLGIRRMERDDMVEIDSLDDLMKVRRSCLGEKRKCL